MQVPNVLQRIVQHKREEVAERKKVRPVTEFINDLRPSSKDFQQALAGEAKSFIMEYKKASPSRGDIRPDLDVEELLKAYQPCADAISVLTDEKFFSGSHKNLQRVAQLTDKPVLCKDFFVDTYQVYEARLFGADAILLMLSVLTDSEYRQLAEVAASLNLDILTEVHSEAECQRALNLGAAIIGINNRDLKSLTTELTVTEKLAPLINNGSLIISESGIESRADAARLAPIVDGFLVGSSLMSAPDIGVAAKALAYGRVKICGVKTEQEARCAFESGATYVGLMFFPDSARAIEPSLAQAISASIEGRYVGVFVNQSEDFILTMVETCHLEVVQLHGNESPDMIQSLRKQLPGGVSIWKALAANQADLAQSILYYNSCCDKLLFDCQVNEAFGGNGQSFDWRLLSAIRDQVGDDSRIIVAGGIDQKNVSQLTHMTAITLDLSSGVERAKGIKDLALINAFFQQLKCFAAEQPE